MYVKDTLIRHELNRVHNTVVHTPEIIRDTKAKIEILHDLEILNEEQYIYELDRLSHIKCK